jgi:hypothetical protein
VAARVTQQHEEPEQAEEEDRVTTSADLGFKTTVSREIEVDPIQEVPQPPDEQGFVIIRMAETIEEFTYGNPHMSYHLKQGHRYRVPVHIAQYLDALGYLYHN